MQTKSEEIKSAAIVELLCLSALMPLRVFNIVFCKTLFGSKYYIL
jgi:hypothetical protein